MSGRGRYLLAGGILLALGLFLAWPLAHVFYGSVVDAEGFTTLYLTRLVTDAQQREALGLSALIALYTTLGCAALAVPLAWLFARREWAGKAWLAGGLLLPLIMPPFVGAVGMKIVFARCGALSTLLLRLGVVEEPVDWFGGAPLLGVVVLEVLHLFPILYLNAVAAIANIDPGLEEAAANLGAPPGRVFRRVTLPLAAPGLFAGLVLVFIWSFTELGTPLVFGVRQVLPVRIFNAVSEIGTSSAGYAQVVLVLAVTVAGFLLSKHLLRRGRSVATLGRMSTAAALPRLSPARTALAWAGLGAVILVAVVPHLSVLLLSTHRRWFLTVWPEGLTAEFFGRALSMELTRGALTNSLLLSVAASVLDVLLGFAIAWLCVRGRIRGSNLLDAAAMLPLAVPGLVIAFGYLGAFSGLELFGGAFDPRVNPLPLLAVSYAVRRLPYMTRAAHAGLEQVNPAFEEAAANLGATPLRVIRRVTLPLIGANLLAGVILCFSFSMLEVSDSLILAQQEIFYPLTKAIYVLLSGLESGTQVAAALGVWGMALLGTGILFATTLMGRRLGQMFRAG
jgi:iron(III) transport system permease protein